MVGGDGRWLEPGEPVLIATRGRSSHRVSYLVSIDWLGMWVPTLLGAAKAFCWREKGDFEVWVTPPITSHHLKVVGGARWSEEMCMWC